MRGCVGPSRAQRGYALGRSVGLHMGRSVGPRPAAALRVQCGAAQGHGTRRRNVRMRRGATTQGGQGCRGASPQVFGILVAHPAPHQEVVGVGRLLGKGGRLTTGFWRHPDAAGTSPGGCWRLAAWVGGPASPQAFGREGGGWREEGAPHPGLLAPSPNVCSSSRGGGVSSPQAVGAPDASVGSAGPPHPRLSAAPAVGGGGGCSICRKALS